MNPLRRTCKEATALMVAREDRDLGWADRLALRLHLAACSACPAFERQMLTMRRVLRGWRDADPQPPAGAADGAGPKQP